ncbi:MAG TPA: RNA methyltransferase [Bacteroidales bacterium]|nr:RNA methyltransferase [Bacteroidales bacterium]
MDKQQLIEYFQQFVSERRARLFDRILDHRTRYVTVVMEDIFQPQNASAVLRTCDCFGVQDVHIIENRNSYTVNPDVALGSDKWLTLVKYSRTDDNTSEAYSELRRLGYRIVATNPHKGDVTLEDFDLTKGKTAFVFGTELKGLSSKATNEADEYLRIPMFGFTESFNVSVSAALILHYITNRLRSSPIDWKLNPEEIISLKLEWLRKSIKNADLLEKQFQVTWRKR